ncbi:MAG: thioredoxin [Clostridia bacterium]|jgi:thioredoxin 1|uniref:thioredoxin n=1 Tax=Bacteroides acidifaciens TaxID=85831 RepID=UPI0023C257AD|nr:thioredoxin [Bacteroides acidifaciens]MCI8911349.1 thioredoxin [Clostridia bacterium]MDE6820797.1 thioredoxin [Bacteroides acidifaciens]
MAVIELTSENFNSEVLECDKTVLIDFWASWCAPCRMLSPVVDEIAEENTQIKVCKVNVDKEGELAAAFRVSSIPMLVVIKDKKVVETSVGVVPKQKILQMINI